MKQNSYGCLYISYRNISMPRDKWVHKCFIKLGQAPVSCIAMENYQEKLLSFSSSWLDRDPTVGRSATAHICVDDLLFQGRRCSRWFCEFVSLSQ